MTLPQVVLGQHFKKYRTTAAGMAFSGGCVGSFFFPVLLELLLFTYGMGGTFLIMAGFVLNVLPAAMLLRKPSWLHKKLKKNIEVSTLDNKSDPETVNQVQNSELKKNKKNCNESEMSEEIMNEIQLSNTTDSQISPNSSNISTEYLRKNNEIILEVFSKYSDSIQNGTDKMYLCSDKKIISNELERMYIIIEKILVSEKDLLKCASKSSSNVISELKDNELLCAARKNELNLACVNLGANVASESIMLILNKIITDNVNSILVLFCEQEHSEILKIINQLQQIYKLLKEVEEHEHKPCLKKQFDSADCKENNERVVKNSNTFFNHAKTAIRLHANPIFLLISLCRSVHFLTFVPAITIIVDFAMDKGLTEEDGKYVIAAMSLGDLMGRLCLGWVTDKEYLDLPR